MNSSSLSPHPVVLVVEDDRTSREVRSDLLEQRGCIAIAVGTTDRAFEELAKDPGPDLVLTDIHLNPAPGDTAGHEMAREIRRQRLDLPLAGYSAHFAPGEVSHVQEAFDFYWARGMQTIPEIEASIDVCHQAALDHLQRRRGGLWDRLDAARRSFEGGHRAPAVRDSLVAGESLDVGAFLTAGGVGLRLVGGDGSEVAEPILVWTWEHDSDTMLEVFGHPALYSDGTDAEEAAERLIDLLVSYAEDLRDAGPVSEEVASLGRLLERVVGSSG